MLGLYTFISTFLKIFSSPPYKLSPPFITMANTRKKKIKQNNAVDIYGGCEPADKSWRYEEEKKNAF
jgi:hypothetical protein